MEGLQIPISSKARKPTMNVAHFVPANKTEKLVDMAVELQEFVDQAAADGESLYETEKGILAKVLKMGHLAIDRLLQRQGDGDQRGALAVGIVGQADQFEHFRDPLHALSF